MDFQAFTRFPSLFPGADIDVLLPSLHWLYESRRGGFHDEAPSSLPGLLVDGGANVGRATARWISSFGDSGAAPWSHVFFFCAGKLDNINIKLGHN